MKPLLLRLDPRPAARVLRAMLLVALATSAGLATAFPNRPVTLVVPYTAGGSADVLARVLSLRLTETWGQEVVVVNRPGGGSVFGTHTVVQAMADGHTLLVGNAALAINEALSRRLPYHAARDLAPISLVARQPVALVTFAGSPINGVPALREAARERPGQITYGSPGHGSIGHLAGELLRLVAGVQLTHVAFRGVRETITEVEAGNVSVALFALPTAMPHVHSGRLRLLGVASRRRALAVPDVPTIGETLPDFEFENWIGLLAPYGVSVQLVRTINSSVTRVVRKRDLSMQLTSLGYEPVASTPGQFQNRISSDIERYMRIVAAAGLGMP